MANASYSGTTPTTAARAGVCAVRGNGATVATAPVRLDRRSAAGRAWTPPPIRTTAARAATCARAARAVTAPATVSPAKNPATTSAWTPRPTQTTAGRAALSAQRTGLVSTV